MDVDVIEGVTVFVPVDEEVVEQVDSRGDV